MEDVFRKTYSPLTDQQKTHMELIKSGAEDLLGRFHGAVPAEERSERSRCMAIARTHLETAVMFAVKAVTTSSQ